MILSKRPDIERFLKEPGREIRAARDADADAVRELALSDPAVSVHLAGLTVRKVIVVPGRIVNIVAG